MSLNPWAQAEVKGRLQVRITLEKRSLHLGRLKINIDDASHVETPFLLVLFEHLILRGLTSF